MSTVYHSQNKQTPCMMIYMQSIGRHTIYRKTYLKIWKNRPNFNRCHTWSAVMLCYL